MPDVAVPRPLGGGDVDAGVLPKAQLRLVGAGAVAARHERYAGLGDLAEGCGDVLLVADVRGVGGRPDDHEIIIHDVEALHAEAFRHEFFFRRPVVDERHVGVPAPADVERLAGADRDDVDADPGARREQGQEVAEQAGLFGRGRGGDRDRAFLCNGEA